MSRKKVKEVRITPTEARKYILEALSNNKRARGMSIDMICSYIKENHLNVDRNCITDEVIHMSAWKEGIKNVGRHNYTLDESVDM